MPKRIVDRATEILKDLERMHRQDGVEGSSQFVDAARQGMQLSFFQLDDPVLEQVRDELKKVNIDNLTPVEALLKLQEIKRLTGGR